jgi:hypothetical protein
MAKKTKVVSKPSKPTANRSHRVSRVSKHRSEKVPIVEAPVPRIVAPSTDRLSPRLICERHAYMMLRLERAAFENKSQRVDEEQISSTIPPEAVVAAFQASGFLEHGPRGTLSDAVFVRQERIEPLPIDYDQRSDDEKRRIADELNRKRFGKRQWFAVDENALVWDSVELWGREVLVTQPSPSGHAPMQVTKSGMVEQWRHLMQLAVRYRQNWAFALCQPALHKEAGFVENMSRETPAICLAVTNGAPVYAAIPKSIVERWNEEQGQPTSTYGWTVQVPAYGPDGRPQFRKDGELEVAERWERTHEATSAGSAVLAWAFAQLRLRRIFDALDVGERAGMPSVAKCLVHLGPILGWKQTDFDLVARAEIELIAVANSVKLVGKESQRKIGQVDQPLSELDIRVLKYLAKSSSPVQAKTLDGLPGWPSYDFILKSLNELETRLLVDRPLGERSGFSLTPQGRQLLSRI